MDTDTLLSLPNWKSKSDIPKEYTGNCYAGGYALEVKNGRITSVSYTHLQENIRKR